MEGRENLFFHHDRWGQNVFEQPLATRRPGHIVLGRRSLSHGTLPTPHEVTTSGFKNLGCVHHWRRRYRPRNRSGSCQQRAVHPADRTRRLCTRHFFSKHQIGPRRCSLFGATKIFFGSRSPPRAGPDAAQRTARSHRSSLHYSSNNLLETSLLRLGIAPL